MNLQLFKNRNGIIVLVSVIAVILIYSIDIFKLKYRAAGWEQFGETPVTVSKLQYFVADTPNLISYKETDGGEVVSCAETVAYVETDTQETFRCCDTGSKISCLAGDFANEIPATDDECTGNLRGLFGVPVSLANTKEYEMYGSCPDGASILTVAQLDNNGQILWKSFKVNEIGFISSTLKCILGPLLLILAIWIIAVTLREKRNEPIPRF